MIAASTRKPFAHVDTAAKDFGGATALAQLRRYWQLLPGTSTAASRSKFQWPIAKISDVLQRVASEIITGVSTAPLGLNDLECIASTTSDIYCLCHERGLHKSEFFLLLVSRCR